MSTFLFRVYYEYRGPTKSDPFERPKTEDEISFALSRVKPKFQTYLNDQNATVTVESRPSEKASIFVSVDTTDTRATVVAAMEKCLKGLGLFGDAPS